MISLHFHHVDPASKSFNMTMASGKSEAAYLAEAKKCVLVCANCHGEIEAGLIESPPAKEASLDSPPVSSASRDVADGQLRLYQADAYLDWSAMLEELHDGRQ